MKAEELGQTLILFCFFSELNLHGVIDNGLWHFERYMLVLHELKTCKDPTTVPLHLADFRYISTTCKQVSFGNRLDVVWVRSLVNLYVTIRNAIPTSPKTHFYASESRPIPLNR
ncbi:hypothetical protein LINGRAHAP2_LOCUS31673 [Linum grandiflorum]